MDSIETILKIFLVFLVAFVLAGMVVTMLLRYSKRQTKLTFEDKDDNHDQ